MTGNEFAPPSKIFLIFWLCDLVSNIRLIRGLFTPVDPSQSGSGPGEDISLEREEDFRAQKIQNAKKGARENVKEVPSAVFYQTHTGRAEPTQL